MERSGPIAIFYELYGEAYTPWGWQPKLREVAQELGIDCFSTPYERAVGFLEEMDVPVHKVASFEVFDLPLLRKIGRTGKPVIMSTGTATLAEIDEAVRTLRAAGNRQLALLKCTSAYPAPPEEMNLHPIPHLSQSFGVPVGLSDHTMGITAPLAAVALGACIIEKHFTLSRSIPGPDSAFSVEPDEFRAMVEVLRMTEKALGAVRYGVNEEEAKSRAFHRSFLDRLDFELIYAQGDFPMEFFLLMGDEYVGDDEVGSRCHHKRINFEMSLPSDLRRRSLPSISENRDRPALFGFGKLTNN